MKNEKVSKVLPRKELTRSTPLVAKAPMKKCRSGKRRALSVRDADWLSAVRSLECCVRCGSPSIQAAHADIDKGMGQKTDDCTACALCGGCHYELGNGNKLSRDDRRSEMDRCLRLTLIALFRAGKVGRPAQRNVT